MEPLSTGTMTGLAIQFALNVAFSENEGARAKSPDISKVTRTNNNNVYSGCKTSPVQMAGFCQ